MKLEGSCHCKKVKYTVESSHPYPFNLCYCTICRKTAGGGGYTINLSAHYKTLEFSGKEFLKKYQAKIEDDNGNLVQSQAERYFCGQCGSALWLWDERWPELLHPFASSIDSKLPEPPVRTHFMVKHKANWVKLRKSKGDLEYKEYPKESIKEWHQKHNLEQ